MQNQELDEDTAIWNDTVKANGRIIMEIGAWKMLGGFVHLANAYGTKRYRSSLIVWLWLSNPFAVGYEQIESCFPDFSTDFFRVINEKQVSH